MFGYIKPCKPEMKVKEFDTFKSVYCGLCKQMSKDYSPLSTITLSYDFAFVALLALSFKEECGGFQRCRCVANPLKKKVCHIPCEDLSFCSDAAMLMLYYKLKDDLLDSGFFKKIVLYPLLPLAKLAQKKARKRQPEIDTIIAFAMKQQAALEANATKSVDRAAHPSSEALGSIFEALSDDSSQKTILHRFGYLLGRYIYFADAVDDLEKDKQSGGYNPLLYHDGTISEQKEYGRSITDMTIGELAPAYELLPIKRYKPILDNIIYLGLHEELAAVLSGKKEKTNERQF